MKEIAVCVLRWRMRARRCRGVVKCVSVRNMAVEDCVSSTTATTRGRPLCRSMGSKQGRFDGSDSETSTPGRLLCTHKRVRSGRGSCTGQCGENGIERSFKEVASCCTFFPSISIVSLGVTCLESSSTVSPFTFTRPFCDEVND